MQIDKYKAIITLTFACLPSQALSAQALSSVASLVKDVQPVRLTVAPATNSSISMKTLPNARCVLHAVGTNDTKHSLTVFAGEDGMVRFYVQPSAESNSTAGFQLDCTAGSQSATFPLELRASYSSTAEMPAPVESLGQLAPQGTTVRPALSQADALNLSPQELANKGYPPRPDSQRSPSGFATWLKAVTKPSVFIAPHLSSNPGRTHRVWRTTANFETTSNWSGFELRGAANSYVAVNGQWNVPSVSYETNTHTYSAYWIGLDGDGTSDLVQAGTEQEITDIYLTFFGGINFTFTNYYAWTEFLPQQPTEQVISNFPVSPSDEIICSVAMGGNFFIPELSGPDAIFNIENVTKGTYTSVVTPKGSTSVGGSEAEWVMERPTVNGSLPDLANYGYTFMYDASALSANTYNWVDYDAANFEQIFMYNGNDLLSAAFSDGTNTILFYWFAFH